MFSPVVMFVYNRADHFKQTFDALSECPEAKESELFIFSDGAKNEAGKKAVDEVRKAIHEAAESDCFKKIHIIESDANKGLASSVINGVTSVIEQFGRVIVIEDDCVASPYLLTYMNKCLDFYENDKTVGSIAGFTPCLKFPSDFSDDVFAAYRSCSCTWGSWEDRWQGVDWELKHFDDFYKDKVLVRRLNSNGSDRFIRLYRQTKGNGTSWSVRFGAHLARNNQVTIYPRYSYIRNIGCDETGVHSKAEDAEKIKVDISKAIPNPNPVKAIVIPKLQKIMRKYYSCGIVSDIKRAIATKMILLKGRK